MTPTQQFVLDHRNDDVRQLALRRRHPAGVDMPYALQQIAGWQAARHKLPSWAEADGIIYPPHISLEQCSSEQAAVYKARLAARWAAMCIDGGAPPSSVKSDDGKSPPSASAPSPSVSPGNMIAASLVDITGGMGVDFSFMAKALARVGALESLPAIYVERQAHLCEAARHNMPLLGLSNVRVVEGDGASVLSESTGRIAVVFADPARRDTHGARTYGIAQCTPDVAALMPLMLGCAAVVMLKLSPMLDITKAVTDITESLQQAGWQAEEARRAVREVHVVSVGGECKELLLVVTPIGGDTMRLVCVNDDTEFAITRGCGNEPIAVQQAAGYVTYNTLQELLQGPDPLCIFEPNASVMKAGAVGEVAARYGLMRASANSNLLFGRGRTDAFPGRMMRLTALSTMNRRGLKTMLQGVDKANITTRNFPLTPVQLRQRLRLKDGGPVCLFATTMSCGTHVVVMGKRE